MVVTLLLTLAVAAAPGAAALTVDAPEASVADALPRACRDAIPLVVKTNEPILDAPEEQFCRGITDRAAREECRRRVTAEPHAHAVGTIEVLAAEPAPDAGREWPGAERVSSFVAIEARVPIAKAGRTSTRDVDLLCFDSRRDGAVESCLFPASHWYWSELSMPDRFATAPRGVCAGDRVLSFTEYLREVPPPPESLWAIRFLSQAEADAWASGDPERIKHRGQWNPDHEYAKFFLVGSLAWWRGMRPETPRADYGFAVRLPALSLERVHALEQRGAAFLNIFEEGRAIELTLIDRDALVDVLAQDLEILADVSGPGATGPELRPYRPDDATPAPAPSP